MTRLQPYFNPGPDGETVAPPVYLGGVQRRACELAGAVADGFVSHPTNSNPRYLRETCLPALAAGAHGRPDATWTPTGFETVVGTSVISSSSPTGLLAERERQRRLLAFLYSTPAYAPTLRLYGWGELGPRLRDLVRRERWDDLGDVLSDEVLDTLVPSGTFDELPGLLLERFAGLGQGILVAPPQDPSDDEAFRSGRGRGASRLSVGSAGHGEDDVLVRHGVDGRPPLLLVHPGVAVRRVEHAGQERDVARACRTHGRPASKARSARRGRSPRRS